MGYIYFCRSSFCMGDDCCAPNMRRFDYSSESFTEDQFRTCITNYFTNNLPNFKWIGYCNGEFIASADCVGEDDDYHVVIEVTDNWKDMLNDMGTVFFDHHDESEQCFGIRQSQYYTLEKASNIYNQHSIGKR